MNQSDIDLLFKDLSMRLPYGVHTQFSKFGHIEFDQSGMGMFELQFLRHGDGVSKPLLRPLSDLFNEIEGFSVSNMITHGYHNEFWNYENFILDHLYCHDLTILLKYHFDVHGLIPKGLAIDVNTLDKNPYK